MLLCGEDQLVRWIKGDPACWEALLHVRNLDLPDCWIGAGFVRNLVWSRLHGLEITKITDVDVIWFGSPDDPPELDSTYEAVLLAQSPSYDWSVKNQARMHTKNGDKPYLSSEDAMRYWPETATAIAARRTLGNQCELLAPFGVDDLLSLKLRPAGRFAFEKKPIFEERLIRKGWLDDFPMIELSSV